MNRRPLPVSALPVGVLLTWISMSMPVAAAQEVLVPPEASIVGQPDLPLAADGRPVEGWAIVRYSVSADGSTDNVRTIGIAPPMLDPAPIEHVVGQWRFRPATRDGEAIDWHNNESVVVFRSETGTVGPSAEFQSGYEAITNSMEMETPQGVPDPEALPQFDTLLEANRDLIVSHARRFEDVALAVAQTMMLEVGLDERHAAYELARLVTPPQQDVLQGEDLLVALQVRLRLERQLGRTSDALATYRRISARYAPDDRDPFAALAENLAGQWEDEEILPVLGHVRTAPWRIDAERRVFSLGNIDGTVESIDAECDTARLKLEYQPAIDWSLPESFGACSLFVNATPGTSFRFYEMLPTD